MLAAGHQGAERSGPRCTPSAPVRAYDVVAMNVDITLNRYRDHDPEGRMYVLERDLPRVRQEEQQNAKARAGQPEPAVSLGLQGDAIQPLTLRVNQGECLRINLRNALEKGEPAGLHLHGASLHLAGTTTPVTASNPRSFAPTGGTVRYEWMVDEQEPEGTHYFHSPGDDRFQTGHGLFGSVIVEPKGSTYLDPIRDGELQSGWTAIIRRPEGASFREAALYYHEVGSENYRLMDRTGNLVPLVDPLTSAYRPSARALNYRSEPFMNRLMLQKSLTGRFDESLSYGSYTFGDPATPMVRSYLGDPVKQRVIHGGSEVFHVHHVHGGAIRWRRQPHVEPAGFDRGLDKHPPLRPQASERVDSQSIGPSETYDVENECGSGGCQQSVGDYLIHCHVAHHYFAGMWSIWRVYNTKQNGQASTDALPPLRELPDRIGKVEPAVTSDQLAGRTVDWYGKRFTIGQGDLASWVERQLPPAGAPRGYDASVFDWRKEGDRYLNEPEDKQVWPGYHARAPDTRPPLTFDPKTGKLAYPFLRPHLGKRPPFAPNHGPAPFLDPFSQGTEPPRPGENGPASVCPDGTKLKPFTVNAIAIPITLNRKANLVDPAGEIYVLQEQEGSVRGDHRLRVPLTIRANAGQECIDLTLKSKLEDSPDNRSFSKVNLHIHFVQFDIQASDGVITGFNYEQSVRPFGLEGEALPTAAGAGDTSVRVGSAARFQAGVLVGVGMDQNDTFEVKRVKEISGNALVFDEPLRHAHASGEIVSTEFVRYRWYPDVQFGTAYFHDHVNAIASWRHGLFGALISEPPGSTYHDPRTGTEIKSGPIADIHTASMVSADVSGSFREVAMFVQDDNPITHVGRSSGSSLNLRAEPLEERNKGDPSQLFSSKEHGDPETPIVEAYLGDPIVVRLLVGGTNEVHTWHVDGHWFRVEPYSSSSPPISTIHAGIAERYDLTIPKAGGAQRLPGDYLYYSGRSFKLREGSWGIVRVRDGSSSASLQKLPGHEVIPPPAPAVCPAGAPQKQFDVATIEALLPMLGGARGKLFVIQSDKTAVLSGSKAPEPLVLHVNIGDCIKVKVTNETSSGPVSFHADMLAFDPGESGGVAAGFNAYRPVAPGEVGTFTYFAHPEVGETTALVRDWGNVLKNPAIGLYGAIIVGPRGATYADPGSGDDMSSRAGWRVDVHPPGAPAYRDFTLFFQDEDAGIGTHRMPYTEQVDGVVGLNYRMEPLSNRLAKTKDAARVFSSAGHADPATPVMDAAIGDPVRIHVLVPWSEQAQVFHIEGHRWPFELGRSGTDLLSSVQVGGLEATTLSLDGGAGGRDRLPGDYLYGDHRTPYRDAGLWGILRVHSPCSSDSFPPLDRANTCAEFGVLGIWTIPVIATAVFVGLLLAVVLVQRRRRSHRP